MTIGLPAPQTVSKTAAADCSSSKWMCVALDSDGKVVPCTASTDLPFGVLQNDPVTDEVAEVAPVSGGGSSYIYLSGTLASAALQSIDASGKAAADTAGNYNIGVLEFGGAIGELGVIRLGNITVKA